MTKFWNAVKIPLLAILCSLVVGGVIIAVTGSNPFKAYYALLQGSGLSPKSSYASYKSMLTDFMSYVNYFTPMIFAALAVAVALRAGLFNIGVSGQMLAAGFTASIIVGYSSLNAVLAKPLVVIIGLIVGGLVGGLIGFLKYRFNINEVVSSIMLNYTFQYVISFFINTFFVDPVSRVKGDLCGFQTDAYGYHGGQSENGYSAGNYSGSADCSGSVVLIREDKIRIRTEGCGLFPQCCKICGY